MSFWLSVKARFSESLNDAQIQCEADFEEKTVTYVYIQSQGRVLIKERILNHISEVLNSTSNVNNCAK